MVVPARFLVFWQHGTQQDVICKGAKLLLENDVYYGTAQILV